MGKFRKYYTWMEVAHDNSDYFFKTHREWMFRVLVLFVTDHTTAPSITVTLYSCEPVLYYFQPFWNLEQ